MGEKRDRYAPDGGKELKDDDSVFDVTAWRESALTILTALNTLQTTTLKGYTDGGDLVNVPVTPEGHIEVALHSPRLPFGSIHAESMTPVFQADGVYGINNNLQTATTTLSGTATTENSGFKVSTGTTIYSQGVIQGKKRLRYRAGQGVVGRFAGRFTTPVANSYQLVGFGHSEDGLYIGYGDTSDLSNTSFGVLYSKRGKREVRTLTITTGSSTAENAVVTLNGTAYNIAVTNSANIQRTVWELSQGTYAGWDAYPAGATVVFIRQSAGAASGAYSITGTTLVGSFAQTRAGAASTEQFINQANFNGDKLDGTGPSGFTIDPTKGNVFEIGIQYLGFGSIDFSIEIASDSNNPEWVVFHTLKPQNTLTDTTFGNPSFPFTMAAYSAGSTTDLSIKVGSYGGFIEGPKVLHGPRQTYYNQLGTNVVSSSVYHALFTVLSQRYWKGVANQSVVNMLSITAALKHTSPCIIYLVRNGSLVGNPNFAEFANQSSTLWDTASTAVTWTDNGQVVWTGHMGDTGEIDHHFGNGMYNAEELTIQPGEWITVCAKTTTGNASWVTASLNTREDQ